MADNNASVALVLDKATFLADMDETTQQVAAQLDSISAHAEKFSSSTRRNFNAISGATLEMARTTASASNQIGSLYVEMKQSQGDLTRGMKLLGDASFDQATAMAIVGSALQRATDATRAFSASQEGAAASAQHAMTNVQAIGGTVRVLEGNAIRATERFIDLIGLGPLFQALFPIAGALAFGEMLVLIGERAYKLYDNVVNLHKASKDLDEIDLKLIQESKQFEQALERQKIKFIELTQGAVAAKKAEEDFYKTKAIDLSKFFDEKSFRDLPDRVKVNMQSLYQSILPQDLDAKIAQTKQKIQDITDFLSYKDVPKDRQDKWFGVDAVSEAALVQRKRLYGEILQQLTQAQELYNQTVRTDEADTEHAIQGEVKKTGKTREEERRKAQAALHKYNEDAVNKLIARSRAEDAIRKQQDQNAKFALDNFIRDEELKTKTSQEEVKKRIEAMAKAATDAIQIDERQLAEAEHSIELLYRTHALSYQKRGDMVRQALAKEEQLELQHAAVLRQLYKDDPVKFQEAEDRKLEIEERFTQRRKQLAEQEAQHQQQTLDKIDRIFQSSFDGWVRGSESFGQAWNRTLGNMSSLLSRNLEKMLADWVTHYAQKDSISLLSSIKELTHHAMDAAGAAYKSTAAIPIIGPALAPEAAALAFAAVEGFGGLASARSGMVSAEEQMAFIHKNEMVLPASLSTGFQSIIGRMNGAEESGAAGNGDFHMHGDVNYNAAPGEGLSSNFWSEFRRGVRHGKHLD